VKIKTSDYNMYRYFESNEEYQSSGATSVISTTDLKLAATDRVEPGG
jgi:hypothetical protein